jgi:chaperonin GroES
MQSQSANPAKPSTPVSSISLLRPLPSRVVLRRLEPATTPSLYVMPDSAKEKPVEAEVLAIPTVPTYEYGICIPCPLLPGMKVLIGKYAGDIKFRNEDVTIVRWDEILAVIADPDESGQQVPSSLSSGLPSAADLDRASEEASIATATQTGYNQQQQRDRKVPRP